MAHYHFVEDDGGDVVDVRTFCSDWCHRTWCERNSATYGGWNGCHEQEFSTVCEECEEEIEGVNGWELS
jgi:hypothetical protein